MNILWLLGTILVHHAVQGGEMVQPGPPSGIVLQDNPGLLLTNCRVYTQRCYTRLDPWSAYHTQMRYFKPSQTGSKLDIRTQTNLEHTQVTTIHILKQLQKFVVSEDELDGLKRPKDS